MLSPNHEGINRLMTGTTTVGIVVNDGVVLATDRRVTAGYYIAHRKRGVKIWKIDNHVAATMSGGVADLQKVLDALTSVAAQYKIETGKPISIRALANYASLIVFSSRPYIYLVHMIFGGWDPDEGPVIYMLDFFGTLTRETEFMSTGSGSPTAFGVLEDGYRRDMNIDDAIRLAVRAVRSAIYHDPGSGEGVDVVVITKDGYKEIDSTPYIKELTR
ncbi:MAG: proteasome subunit beta [Vulcanisaeta sp.]|jgi:proteasome endopeptidase complex, beta component (EC 3.4.25.1). Threonine peptidase. MEROPS family T01A|nr:proteasome subunit beta [Vulcanisaeta sp.]MCG2866061.1 proteasome subunit beta [Vulcanisaeta sp.]MCG2885394.1 proteasome subunit beta [Vulcanisaeta sp.]PVU72584.1 proteasome subunit beta [Vulcanisaeta sp. SCGC AB-777_J10]